MEESSDFLVVRLRGELDGLSSERVTEDVQAAAGPGPCNVVLNLRSVQFIDSTGLSAIRRLAQVLRERGGRLALSSPSDFCRSLMERVGLDRVVPPFASDESARAFLAGGER